MLGYAVESVDFNLPVDSFTRKPLFAFSCNRAIRESYDGPLFENEDGDDVGISDLSSNVGKKIVKIYDQKVRHGHSLHNATVTGDVYLQSEAGPYYYLDFDGSSYFTLPIAQYFTKDAGVYAVCDPIPVEVSPDTLNPNFCLTQSCGLQPNNNHPNDHTFSIRPILVALQTASGLTKGKYYEVKAVNTTNGGVNIWELGGASEVGWYQGTGRGTLWEIVNEIIYVNGGRAPVFSANSSTHELSFDLGSAYMRFTYYPDSEKQLLFGGIDSPDSRKDGYAGNYADNVILQSVKGTTGESRKRHDIASLDTAYIGRDKDYYYEGKIYELVITDFEIPRDSINQVFSDWRDYYALT